VCSIALGLAVVGVATALALRGPMPELGPVIVLGALFMLAENQVVELPNNADVSISFMLGMAAIVVFYGNGSPLGPMLVGVCGGIYLPHVVAGDWRKVCINSANFGFAMLATAVVFNLLAPSGPLEVGPLVLLAFPAAVVFMVLNLGMFGLTGVVFTGKYPNLIDIFGPLIPQTYPFSILGVFLGLLYVDYGVVFVPLFVVPILVARQTFASYLALKESQEAAVRTLIGALEAKDPYTAGHAERVADYAQYIGQELGMSPSRLERLRFAALMHDVGKLVVPNHLLNKKGKLTAEEFAQVRMHEDVSVEILTRIDFLAPVAPSATSEAAEFAPVADDRGQPVEPHIVAVADAYDAMTSTRSYRKALAQETAFLELRQNSGKQFHPRVVDALIVAIERRGEVHGRDHEVVVHHEDAPEMGTGSAGLGDLMPDPAENSGSGAGR
jgi:hypothetical protein